MNKFPPHNHMSRFEKSEINKVSLTFELGTNPDKDAQLTREVMTIGSAEELERIQILGTEIWVNKKEFDLMMSYDRIYNIAWTPGLMDPAGSSFPSSIASSADGYEFHIIGIKKEGVEPEYLPTISTPRTWIENE